MVNSLELLGSRGPDTRKLARQVGRELSNAFILVQYPHSFIRASSSVYHAQKERLTGPFEQMDYRQYTYSTLCDKAACSTLA